MTYPTTRRVTSHAHPELVDAVAISRFWRMVDSSDPEGCWPWRGDSDDGYGVFFYQGRMRRAAELALSFTTGEKRLPDFDTCHACDNPPCCNPAHLRFGTRQSNVDEMCDRGRAVVGARSPFAKLTDEAVLEIRLRRAAGARQKDLAAQYGISSAYVSDIVNGLAWQHVGGPITGTSKRTSRRASRGKVA